MTKFSFVIRDALGIHARPAGQLVKEAKRYESHITIKLGGKQADAKKLFAVMALGAKVGEEILVQAEGPDETTAATALEGLMQADW